ncbi:3D domain-containing protein [Paenibacillus sp. UNC451MF]|uniref:3D domain-containing protein n=1 Tax=Paenibacillus sp. UNC451MF TaxID=1449063 RepID=UPI0006906BEA|nr:3D domain-containing protein [Paenibacillus sp. UNC451MF]
MFRKSLSITLLLPMVLLINLTLTAKVYAYHVLDDGSDMIEAYSVPYYYSLASPEPDTQPAVQELSAPEPLFYQVNSGDTLYKIARDFGTTITSIMVENNISDPHILSIGQKLQIPSTDSVLPLPDGQQKVIKQVLSSTLTAYTAGKESTGKEPSSASYGITYSGSKAEEGRTIAVDPAVIPIGSMVFIDGIGIRTAEDTGSAVRGARIDVFMDDLKQAVNFGVKKNVKVYVLS